MSVDDLESFIRLFNKKLTELVKEFITTYHINPTNIFISENILQNIVDYNSKYYPHLSKQKLKGEFQTLAGLNVEVLHERDKIYIGIITK